MPARGWRTPELVCPLADQVRLRLIPGHLTPEGGFARHTRFFVVFPANYEETQTSVVDEVHATCYEWVEHEEVDWVNTRSVRCWLYADARTERVAKHTANVVLVCCQSASECARFSI